MVLSIYRESSSVKLFHVNSIALKLAFPFYSMQDPMIPIESGSSY